MSSGKWRPVRFGLNTARAERSIEYQYAKEWAKVTVSISIGSLHSIPTPLVVENKNIWQKSLFWINKWHTNCVRYRLSMRFSKLNCQLFSVLFLYDTPGQNLRWQFFLCSSHFLYHLVRRAYSEWFTMQFQALFAHKPKYWFVISTRNLFIATEIKQTSTRFMTWISNHILHKRLNVITHSCLNPSCRYVRKINPSHYDFSVYVFAINEMYTGTQMLSFWRNFRHWHRDSGENFIQMMTFPFQCTACSPSAVVVIG